MKTSENSLLILFSVFFLANFLFRQSFQSALLESPLLDELEPFHLCFSSLSGLYRVQYHTTLVLLSSCLFGLRPFPFHRQWLDEAIPIVQLPSPAMASKQTCNNYLHCCSVNFSLSFSSDAVVTAGCRRLAEIGTLVCALRLNMRCAGLVAIPCDGVFLKSSTAIHTLPPEFSAVRINIFAVFTALSTIPLACGQ